MFYKNLELGSTNAYRDRRGTWIGVTDINGEDCDGILSITTYSGSKVETTVYAVHRTGGTDSGSQHSIRIWKLAQMVEPTMTGKERMAVEKENARIRPYVVTVTVDKNDSAKNAYKCDCPARTSDCKHQSVVELILKYDLLDGE